MEHIATIFNDENDDEDDERKNPFKNGSEQMNVLQMVMQSFNSITEILEIRYGNDIPKQMKAASIIMQILVKGLEEFNKNHGFSMDYHDDWTQHIISAIEKAIFQLSMF